MALDSTPRNSRRSSNCMCSWAVTSKLAVGGLGVGLYLTRLVIEGHGGTIQAASEGRGEAVNSRCVLPCRVALPAAPFSSSVAGN
jgi:signal transduction histidine kinase